MLILHSKFRGVEGMGNSKHTLVEICIVGVKEVGDGAPNLIAIRVDIRSLKGIFTRFIFD